MACCPKNQARHRVRGIGQAILFLSLLVLLSSAAFAHSVTMNFHFNKNVTDITHIAANYVSVERGGTLAALVFAGSLLTQLSLDQTTDPYFSQMTQDENENRFILALTNGTRQKIESKPAGRVPATTFGDLPLPAAFMPGLALQLQFDSLDLTGLLSPGQILVKSLGRLRMPLVDLQMVL